MNEYLQVARHLGMVRRAWKRAAALSGFAIVCMESVGLLTVALLLDWIYQPVTAIRIVLFVLVLGAIVVLLVRHVIRPLLRKISDDQLAMFVEEHSDQFEGALITAAELNHDKTQTQTPQAIVDAVMRAAVLRADRSNVRSLVDLRRLKKYALAAVVVVAGYGLMCLAFPDTIGAHASRVMRPWQRRGEDLQNRGGPGSGQLLPVEFALSKGDSRLLRRETFDLQAVLSRSSSEPVLLNFRPAGQPNLPWRAVPMKEIDKVNTFAGALLDVDEDQEFYVSTGADRSAVHKIGVYEPLKLTGFEITTQYPAYLKIPDRVEVMPSAELMVPAGSKIKLRILANTALTSGQLTWQDGRQQAMTIENGEAGSAVATFDVTQDTSYSYAVMDGNGQKEQSAVACSVVAMVDRPPTLEVKFPLGAVSANPLGEVTFSAEAVDDFALAGVDLVYQRQLPTNSTDTEPPPITPPVRVPLTLTRAATKDGVWRFPDVAQATVRFALEDLQPPAAPEEVISYYLECKDRKGQALTTDIQMIAVERFDSWPQFKPTPPEEPHFKIVKNITEYLQAAWKLEQQKPVLQAADYAAQAKTIATSMIDPETKHMYPFYDRKKVPPAKIAHADRADKFLASGYQALMSADAGRAVADFRVVLAELTILKLDKNGVEMFEGNYTAKGTPPDYEKDLNKLFQQITLEVEKVEPPPNWNPPEKQAAEKIRKAAEQLAKEQADVVKKAEEIAAAGAAGKPTEKDEDKDKDRAKEQAKKDAKALAAQQDKVAAKTQKEAMTNPAETDKDVKAMGDKLAEAAKSMRDASKNLKENKMEQATADAKLAQADLRKVAERLESLRQEQVAAAVAEAEAKAAKLLKEQKDLRKDTEATAKDTKSAPAEKDVAYKKLTYQQAQLQAKTDRFKKDIEELKNVAQRDAKAETAKNVEETHKEMVTSEPDQKMVNAVVELEAKRGEAAAQEQVKAEQGLEKVLNVLRKADESLAADRESQLARAKEEAKRIDEGLKKLGATAAATQPATTRPVATTAPASQPAVASTQKNAKPTDDESKPLSETDKKALAEDLTYEMDRLARHLADRDFADKPDQEFLTGVTKDGGSLRDDMLNNRNKKNEIATVVRRVRDKLEAEYQVTLDSKRLQDAQRDDCPPSYRQLVNKYYEALSEAGK